MSKIKALIISGILVLVATVLMGSIYTFGNISYSYVPTFDYKDRDVTIKNVKVVEGIDTTRVDGPSVVGNDINVDIDLEPNEVFTFKYDIVNNTNLDYEFTKMIINCLNDTNVNDYLSVSTYYQDGKPINDKDIITKGTLRTVYVTIAYDKNVSDIQSFILNFDMMFNIH
jgi:hypothetical protein